MIYDLFYIIQRNFIKNLFFEYFYIDVEVRKKTYFYSEIWFFKRIHISHVICYYFFLIFFYQV